MGTKVIQEVVPSSLSRSEEVRDKARRFRIALMRWARKYTRSFPWRRTSSPYKTLVAEIMLQRTRSAQVVPVYERFIDKYPNIACLSNACQEEVAEILRPLGLAFRAQSLRKLARVVMDEYNGVIPSRAEEIIKLHGVGPYVASALEAFLGKRRIPIIDANVARVLARVFGIGGVDWRHATAGEVKAMRELSWLCMGRVSPRAYLYGLLDFAAKVCAPRSPSCPQCPMHRARVCAYCESHAPQA